MGDRIRMNAIESEQIFMRSLATRDAGTGDGGPDGLLVAVHFSGVDMPVAERQRAFDRRAAGITLHAKGAEPEPRQADALGLQMFHMVP